MRLQILHVPDCPNVAVLAAWLDEVLAGLGDVAQWRLRIGPWKARRSARIWRHLPSRLSTS
jgi:hypothetical protein